MRKSFSLGTFFGIEIRADFSWIIGFLLLVWMLGSNYFPLTYPNWTSGAVLSAAIATAVLFFLSVLAHELAHSVVSIRLGIPVPKITLFIFGGLTQINREPKRPRDEIMIAGAGPLTSLVLGLAFSVLGWLGPVRVGVPLAAFGKWIGMVNLGLGFFNLLPGMPFDGGRILRAVAWSYSHSLYKSTVFAGKAGQVVAYGMIGLGILLAIRGNWTGGLWITFMGWFVKQNADQSIIQTTMQEIFAGHKAREIMVIDCPQVGPAMTIQKLVEDVVRNSNWSCSPVMSGGRITGLITHNEINAVPILNWSSTTVGAVMIRMVDLKPVSPDTDLLDVFRRMLESKRSYLPVVENGQFVGIVLHEYIVRFLQNRAAVAG